MTLSNSPGLGACFILAALLLACCSQRSI